MNIVTEFFTVTVRCKVPYSDEYEPYEDRGFIMLPESYRPEGEPTRLVISCHGAGGSVHTDDAQVLNQTMSKYLLANGYAVMDMAGLPMEYCKKYGIDYFNNIGGPIAMDSYEKGYQYCIGKYHLRREVLIHGGSMGGISSTNLVLSGRIPILAQTGFCPVLDTYNEIFLNPWSGGLPKVALGKIYSLEQDGEGDYRYDEEKIRPYNPVTNPLTAHYPVPVRFWQSVNDPTVSPEVTEAFIRRIRENGADAGLNLLPDGYHEPQDYGPAVKEPGGNILFDGAPLFITEAIDGAFRFLDQAR